MSTIRVTGLDPTLRGETVRDYFATYGTILVFEHTARLMEATITYSTHEEAARTLVLNSGTPLGNNIMHIEHIRNPPQSLSVNVTGLDAQLTERAIRDLFSRYGTITNVQRLGSQTTITYSQPAEALLAVREADTRIIRGRTIRVAPTFNVVPPVFPRSTSGGRHRAMPQRPTSTIIVWNLPAGGMEEIEELFREYGPVTNISWITRPTVDGTGAEVTYEDSGDARDAIAALDGMDIGDHTIRVSFRQETATRLAPLPLYHGARPGTTIVVTSLSNFPVEEERRRAIEELLRSSGPIIRVDWQTTRIEVTYENSDDASNAIAILSEVGLGDQIRIRAFLRDEEGASPRRESPRRESPPARRRALGRSGRPPEETIEEPKGRRYLLVREAQQLITSNFITQTMVDPENQDEVPQGLTRVTLIGTDGREYDVVARHDEKSCQISPP